jgi:ABC-type transport system involved in multi-copper enzyme maturation permease subunit
MSEIAIAEPALPNPLPAAMPNADSGLASPAEKVGKTKRRRFGLNPVFARELRERSRRTGTPILLTLYLVLLLIVAYFAYKSVSHGSNFQDTIFSGAFAGRLMFEWVLLALFGLVCFFVPGYTASSITGERERQTLVPLQVTLLRPRQIVVGKVLASLAYTVLLVVAAAPILSLAYAIGGLTIGQLLRGVFAILLVSLLLATIAIMWSSMFRRSAAAIGMSYATVLFLLLGTPLITAAFGSGHMLRGQRSWSMLANPFVFVADFVVMPGKQPNDFFFFDGYFSTAAMAYRSATNYFASPWVVAGIVQSILAVLAFLLAKRRMRLPATRER